MGSEVPASPPDASQTLADRTPTRRVPSVERASPVKEAEREWDDAYYEAHANWVYPETREDFTKLFQRVELTSFCDGGWSWWADPADGTGSVRSYLPRQLVPLDR
jgi:hypothetical protein